MADDQIGLFPNTGPSSVPVATELVDGKHRQVAVIGDGDAGFTAVVASDGSLATRRVGGPNTATRTAPTASTADQTLLAANNARRGFLIYNGATSDMYLAFGSTAASSTSFTLILAAGEAYEDTNGFRGTVRAAWKTSGGTCQVTELS